MDSELYSIVSGFDARAIAQYSTGTSAAETVLAATMIRGKRREREREREREADVLVEVEVVVRV